ncbi:BTB domain protein [Rhizoctonia solani AG-3 Rhs1AP]|nr:BTB domain protein [Rhizoctonia solani AG-3 Rhs1AP]
MFKMPKPKGDEPEEGSSLEHPIVIEGIVASDFAALLKVLYASLFSSNQPTPEAPLIIPAFRLANLFNFSELRAYLLPLAEKSLGDVDKIVFAREFGIEEWLVPAYTQLCQREERLSVEEARKLEVDSVLMISHLREQYRSMSGHGVALSDTYYCYKIGCGSRMSYGRNARCGNCQTSLDVYCLEPGATGANANIYNTAIEGEVKKWVEDNYTIRK